MKRESRCKNQVSHWRERKKLEVEEGLRHYIYCFVLFYKQFAQLFFNIYFINKTLFWQIKICFIKNLWKQFYKKKLWKMLFLYNYYKYCFVFFYKQFAQIFSYNILFLYKRVIIKKNVCNQIVSYFFFTNVCIQWVIIFFFFKYKTVMFNLYFTNYPYI